MLLVEHDMDFVMDLTDRIVVMDSAPSSPKARRPRCSAIPQVLAPISETEH